MKRVTKILPLLLILSGTQLAIAQKINLTYTVKSVDSSHVFDYKAISDKQMQEMSDEKFLQNIPFKNITSIEDNINRKFEKVIFNHTVYYSKLLAEGYFKLYQIEVDSKPVYLIYSKNDTVILEKNDSVIDQSIKIDRKYNRKLVVLCKDYPDLWEKAGRISFKKNDLQYLIAALNDKYYGNTDRKKEKNRADFLDVSLKGVLHEKRRGIALDVLMSHYFLEASPNISFRYGLRMSYLEETEFFPELFSGWTQTGPDRIPHKIYVYKDHDETMRAKVFEIPLGINFEITNSKVTPFFYAGLSPTLYFRKITRTDSPVVDKDDVITLNAFAAAGLKFKLTKNLNVLSEYSLELRRGLNLEVGVEYFFNL